MPDATRRAAEGMALMWSGARGERINKPLSSIEVLALYSYGPLLGPPRLCLKDLISSHSQLLLAHARACAFRIFWVGFRDLCADACTCSFAQCDPTLAWSW
jgi:hypothetical protein